MKTLRLLTSGLITALILAGPFVLAELFPNVMYVIGVFILLGIPTACVVALIWAGIHKSIFDK